MVAGPGTHQQVLELGIGPFLTFAQAGGLPNGGPSRETVGPHGEPLFSFLTGVLALRLDIRAWVLLGGGIVKLLVPGQSECQSAVVDVALEIGSLNLTIKDCFEGID